VVYEYKGIVSLEEERHCKNPQVSKFCKRNNKKLADEPCKKRFGCHFVDENFTMSIECAIKCTIFYTRNGHTHYLLKFQGYFCEYWAWNMYLSTCGAMIKMKWYSTSNCKILYLTIVIVCRKNLNQKWPHRLQDYNNWRARKGFFWWGAHIIVNVLKFNRN
jgi:hypothetical protein